MSVTAQNILAAYDLEAALRPRIRKSLGPVETLSVSVEDPSLEDGSEGGWAVRGTLHWEVTAREGSASMQSSGEGAFALRVDGEEEGDGVQIDRAELEVAGFPAVDVEADRAKFEDYLERSIDEAAPRSGESWEQALVRHAGGASITQLGRYAYAVDDVEPLRARLSELRERLLEIREKGFEEKEWLSEDEAAGFTADALDLIAELTGQTWREAPTGAVAELREVVAAFRNGEPLPSPWDLLDDTLQSQITSKTPPPGANPDWLWQVVAELKKLVHLPAEDEEREAFQEQLTMVLQSFVPGDVEYEIWPPSGFDVMFVGPGEQVMWSGHFNDVESALRQAKDTVETGSWGTFEVGPENEIAVRDRETGSIVWSSLPEDEATKEQPVLPAPLGSRRPSDDGDS